MFFVTILLMTKSTVQLIYSFQYRLKMIVLDHRLEYMWESKIMMVEHHRADTKNFG